MFEVNEYIFYGGNGIYKVEDIGMIPMSKEIEYYTLKPVYENKSTIYIPTNNEKAPIRSIIDKENMQEIINTIVLSDIFEVENSKQCELQYKESIRENNCQELVKVIKTSYIRKMKALEKNKSNNIDSRYFKMAEDYLAEEIAAVFNILKEEAKNLIMNELKKIEI